MLANAQTPQLLCNADDETFKEVVDLMLRHVPDPTLLKVEEMVAETKRDADGLQWQVATNASLSGRLTPEVIKSWTTRCTGASENYGAPG